MLSKGFLIVAMKLIYIPLFICSPILGNAAGLVDTISDGAKSTAGVIGDTADKAADAVTDTVDSTNKTLGDEATPDATRAKLDAMAQKTLDRLFAEQPESRALFDKSSGYAVFDAREASFYVVAGYGRGVAVNPKDNTRV